jgi:DNA invertase Pin-like site-specific DNA recombinase
VGGQEEMLGQRRGPAEASPPYQAEAGSQGALAEFGHNLIRERTIAGLEAARARGRLGGRPELNAASTKIAMAKKLYTDKTNSVSDICKTLHISRATLYRYIKICR